MNDPAAPFVFDSKTRRFYHGTRADLKPEDADARNGDPSIPQIVGSESRGIGKFRNLIV